MDPRSIADTVLLGNVNDIQERNREQCKRFSPVSLSIVVRNRQYNRYVNAGNRETPGASTLRGTVLAQII
jgi:hypothetical protein